MTTDLMVLMKIFKRMPVQNVMKFNFESSLGTEKINET